MPSHPIYRQLVLCDGTDNNGQIIKNLQDLLDIPIHCDFQIFCNENNTFIERSLKEFNIGSHVSVSKSSNPLNRMSDILYENLHKCSLIILISDKQDIYKFKSNKIKEIQINTSVIQMNSTDANVKCILYELYRNKRNENAKRLTTTDSRFFPCHQCPLCSQSFHLDNDLQQHSTIDHVPITSEQYQDYFAEISFNKRSHPDDRYKPELYCMICDCGFQSLAARENHQQLMHKGA